ncbi:hypothetical protein Tco_1428469 [Tanacetum coccineum]
MLKTTGNSSKKDNLSMSNSFSALNEEEEEEDEEDVENVYDESANLIQNTKAGGSSSFTAAVDAKYHSPSQTSMRTSQQRRFSSSPLKSEMTYIIDQRLKYSRAELLSLQFASTLVVPPSDRDTSSK